ncbi:hypothetical protein [Kitasatospora sp. NBC_01302]|uniref:hypothetical protein n=1 Tax=Kitasatospora sp. NBC_01302 TaxID=2903575 RepID=UPI002E12EAD6|nr:hypothetical protein OG294_40990 [Kitasatospora sp. NBC_01302]
MRAGDWALHLGPGPGAANLVELTGQSVVSVQRSLSAVEDIRAALGPAGRNAGLVDAEAGDLFEGRPQAGPYDVIVVNAAVGGLSPRWWDQLSPSGVILAPMALGGLHPWVLAGRDPRDQQAYGRIVAVDLPEEAPTPADGPLYAGVRPSPAAAGTVLPMPHFAPRWAGVVPPRLTAEQYADLWLWLAAKDERITAARVDESNTLAQSLGHSWGTGCALIVGDRAVHVRTDGLWVSGDPDDPVTRTLAQATAENIQEWARQRRPKATGLTCRLAQSPQAGPDTLFVTAAWSGTRPIILPR